MSMYGIIKESSKQLSHKTFVLPIPQNSYHTQQLFCQSLKTVITHNNCFANLRVSKTFSAE